MTISEPSHYLLAEEVPVSSRRDTPPRAPLLSHIPRQISMPTMSLTSPAVSTLAQDFSLQAEDYGGFDFSISDPGPWQSSHGRQSPYEFSSPSHDNSNYQVASYTLEPQSMFNYAAQLRVPDQQQVSDGHQQLSQYVSYDIDLTCPRSYRGIDPAAFQLAIQKQQNFSTTGSSYTDGMMQLDDISYSHELPHPQNHGTMHAGYSPLPYESFHGPSDTMIKQEFGQPPDEERSVSEPIQDETNVEKEEPYAKLIYRALLGAPDRTMVLRDIYNWFRDNTDKATDKETKGWQNSIRHNLSMNGAFKKVEQPAGEDAKKGNMWKLTDEAVRDGVKSTTRYRSKAPQKRVSKSMHPAPQRQASGAKGGQAARKTARLRRSERSHMEGRPSLPPDCVSLSDMFREHVDLDPGHGTGAGDAAASPQAQQLQPQPQGLYRFHAGGFVRACPPISQGPTSAAAGFMSPYLAANNERSFPGSPDPHATVAAEEQSYVDHFSSQLHLFSSPEPDDEPPTPPGGNFDRPSIHDQDLDVRSLSTGQFYELNTPPV